MSKTVLAITLAVIGLAMFNIGYLAGANKVPDTVLEMPKPFLVEIKLIRKATRETAVKYTFRVEDPTLDYFLDYLDCPYWVEAKFY